VDQQLQATRESQRAWSMTANALKAKYDGARKLCLMLSIAAAFLAAAASQLPDSSGDAAAGGPRTWLSIGSGVLLALVTLFTLRFIQGKSAAWVKARSASEALKRIAWTYAAGAAPYEDTASRGKKLADDRVAIEAQVDDLLAVKVTPAAQAEGQARPPDTMERPIYVSERAKEQQEWYEARATRHKAAATRLRFVELILAIIATALTVVAGTTDKARVGSLSIDFVALTAVLTTVSGAILAFIEASRLDFLVTSYRAAARQLREIIAADPGANATTEAWSAFVQKVENVLATENGGWMAKLGESGSSA